MEIEAKFHIPDAATFRWLRETTLLAGYLLGAPRRVRVHDTYLDTDSRRLLRAGYALRSRRQEDGALLTLKGLPAGQDVEHGGAIHHREELEVALPASVPPSEWPPSAFRARVLDLAAGEPLKPLFSLHQTRVTRPVSEGARTVAQMSLDIVRLILGPGSHVYRELELECLPDGHEADLVALVECLHNEWGLQPEPRSKFERALELVERTRHERRFLTAEERSALERIAEQGGTEGRRAHALLALDAGASQAQASAQSGLSERRVRYWLAAFRARRLDAFEARSAPDRAEGVPSPPEQPEESTPQPWPLAQLFEHYDVDRSHARAVADLALSLFDALLPVHRLPIEGRPLLEMAALVHNVGLAADPAHHHLMGRDILLAHPPAELDPDAARLVALTTLLHRKRFKPARIEETRQSRLYQSLSPAYQSWALPLAALVRMADGLDYAQTGATSVVRVCPRQGGYEIWVAGPAAETDAERADAKADLWRHLFEEDVSFVVSGRALDAGDAAAGLLTSSPSPEAACGEGPLPARPGLSADDTMAEAARKTLLFHLLRMLQHEPGTRAGEDIEELHDMRVATRRMRAALQLFGDYVDQEQYAPFTKTLRRIGAVLGAVRDLDVFWEKTERYLATLPVSQHDDIAPLRAVWQAEREQRRSEMVAFLDSERYATFCQEFPRFLQQPGAGEPAPFSPAGAPIPRRVRHVLPVVLYEGLAAVRAFDEWVTGEDVPLERLHLLRIASKGLRYGLEFFSEVLGPEAERLIEAVKGLQDHLGDIQDAVVACGLLRDFLTWGTWGHAAHGKRVTLPSEPVVAPGVAAYLAARQTELRDLLVRFPRAWEPIHGAAFVRGMAAALCMLE